MTSLGKMVSLFYIAIGFLNSGLFAQAPDTLWTKTFGDNRDDLSYCIDETLDRGYILTGTTADGAFLLKTDINGNQQWKKVYNFTGVGTSVQQTTDGGYVVSSSEGGPVYIIKTDSLGDTLWTREYSWGSEFDRCFGVTETGDSGFVFIWDRFQGTGSLTIVKLDKIGNELWGKSYPSSMSNSLQRTIDGGFIISGLRYGYAMLMKTDSLGDTLWIKSYGNSSYMSEGESARQTGDNGYIMTGSTEMTELGSKVFLIKTDVNGDSLWMRTYGGDSYNEGFSVFQTSDGGYIIAGGTDSYGAGGSDLYLIKTDSVGIILWTKVLGGIYDDIGRSVRQTYDNKYIMSGFTSSFGAGGCDIWMIKLASDPINIIECEKNDTRLYDMRVYPNPFKDAATFEYTLSSPGTVSIKIYNVLGQEVATILNVNLKAGHYLHRWKTNNISNGVYSCRVTANNYEQILKMTIIK